VAWTIGSSCSDRHYFIAYLIEYLELAGNWDIHVVVIDEVKVCERYGAVNWRRAVSGGANDMK
jgi:glutathione synthase/RimK-type ligase-like ATP-grasp enzyme